MKVRLEPMVFLLYSEFCIDFFLLKYSANLFLLDYVNSLAEVVWFDFLFLKKEGPPAIEPQIVHGLTSLLAPIILIRSRQFLSY